MSWIGAGSGTHDAVDLVGKVNWRVPTSRMEEGAFEGVELIRSIWGSQEFSLVLELRPERVSAFGNIFVHK